MRKLGKKGNILTENIIFLVLNLVFITILLLFIFTKIGSAAVLEEKYSKQISLLIDASKPIMIIHLNMEDAIKIAEKENFPVSEIVKINENVVTVQLRGKGGYSYSFFNNVEVIPNFDSINRKEYYFVISQNG